MGRPTAPDTIFALSSGRPPAAIAVIRTSGPNAFEAGTKLMGSLPALRRATLRELRDPDTGTLLDEAIVLRFEAPASSTGEDLIEYHCHGGIAVAQAVLSVLGMLPGMRIAQPGEFTRRALFNGCIDLTEAEGLADLLEAETEAQRRAAMALAHGGLRAQVDEWSHKVLALSARAEAAIDYVGEEDETNADVSEIAQSALDLSADLRGWLSKPRIERLRDGVRVVLGGPPNSGKSSLLNALVEFERSIVTEHAGTTRDVIEVPISISGIPFVLIDTAGIRDSQDPVESIGVDRAKQELDRADILLWLGNSSDAPPGPGTILVHSKSDLPDRSIAPEGSVAVSVRTGEGIETLREMMVDLGGRVIPAEADLALNKRQAALLAEAEQSLRTAVRADIVLTAEALRGARQAFDRITGAVAVEDLLDAIFGRFCLGK